MNDHGMDMAPLGVCSVKLGLLPPSAISEFV